MSVMSQCYSVIIDCGISAPGHDKEVADGFNSIEERYIYQLISNIQLPGLIFWFTDSNAFFYRKKWYQSG